MSVTVRRWRADATERGLRRLAKRRPRVPVHELAIGAVACRLCKALPLVSWWTDARVWVATCSACGGEPVKGAVHVATIRAWNERHLRFTGGLR